MCGIVGIFNHRKEAFVLNTQIRTMCSKLVHRGPDDEGIFVEEFVGFGIRRLSVIDIEGGSQPIFNEDRSLYIVCNGEIYNYKVLQKDLRNKGHKFRTESDVEVILHLYEEWGADCVRFLRGMFAFAIWDARRNSIYLARDRIGKKPLFYYTDNRQFLFSSEIKGILACKWINPEIDYMAFQDYLQLGYIPAPRSIYLGIKKLLPGHWARIDFEGNLEIETYWEIPWPTPKTCSKDLLISKLDSLLKDAVKLRLMSDAPLGAFLSGGLDSSVIVAIMRSLDNGKIKTYSVGFLEETYDERMYAEKVAEVFATEHRSWVVESDVSSLLPRIVQHFDEPFADPSAIPTYLLSEYTSKNVTVALSGDGGDELFGGYTRYRAELIAQVYSRLPEVSKRLIEKVILKLPAGRGYHGSSVTKQMKLWVEFIRKMESRGIYSPYGFKKTEYNRLLDEDYNGTLTRIKGIESELSVKNIVDKYQSLDSVTQMMLTEMNTYLTDNILVKVDRMSMAHSLEVRCPLLDHRLIEFMANVPTNFKVKWHQSKYLLRQYAKNRMPRGIISRRKHGFSVPLADWFRTSLKPMLLDYLLDSSILGVINPVEVERILGDHWALRSDNSRKIYLLLVLALWEEQQKNNVAYLPVGL